MNLGLIIHNINKIARDSSRKRVERIWDQRSERGDGEKKPIERRKPAAAQKRGGKAEGPKKASLCPVSHQCGGCQYLDMPYEQQLRMKQERLQKLLGKFCRVYPIIGMDNPFHYRNKVHAVFGYRKGEVISGVYQGGNPSSCSCREMYD